LIFPILAALVAPASGAVMTNCHLSGDFEGAVDQDGARAAVKRGDAAPFEKILKAARPQIQGEIVGQLLEQHQGVWLYEFRVVSPDGHMHYMHFGARTGRYVELKIAPCSS
jgi:uncharacterized membrane protein YkoI